MGLFWPPVSTHWQSLTKRQALWLVVGALILELPIRWIVRPDIPYMVPGNFWFNPFLRIAVEAAMILAFVGFALALKAPLPAVGIPLRKWTRWEWGALAVIGTVELIVVILLVGHRWPKIWAAGLMGPALLWVASEFLFGVNQETGFRGMMMSGLLPLTGWKWAYALNTLVFLLGPIHFPHNWSNPGLVIGYSIGVIVHGLAFSWIRHRSDNVVLCGLLHGIINGFMNSAGFVLRANPGV